MKLYKRADTSGLLFWLIVGLVSIIILLLIVDVFSQKTTVLGNGIFNLFKR